MYSVHNVDRLKTAWEFSQGIFRTCWHLVTIQNECEKIKFKIRFYNIYIFQFEDKSQGV